LEEWEELGKKKDEKLDEILRLLRKLLSKKLRAYNLKAYRPRGVCRSASKPLGSHYRFKLGNYQAPRTNYATKPKLNYNPKQERSSSYGGKPWSEPMIYQPKERIVYDPEVKRILKSIEQKLSSESEAEEILRQLESNPKLYERLLERLSKDLEKLESNEPENLGEEAEKAEEYKTNEQSPRKVEEPSEPIDQEPSEEVEQSTDEAKQKSAEVEIKIEKENPECLSEAEISTEPVQEEQAEEIFEPQSEAQEPSKEVIEQIEAQDLSSLEAELYQPLEPLKPTVPDVEPIELIEPMQPNNPSEQKVEGEVEDY
jgi:hypothetical protein